MHPCIVTVHVSPGQAVPYGGRPRCLSTTTCSAAENGQRE